MMMVDGIRKYDPMRQANLETYLMSHMRGLQRAVGKETRILNMPERMSMEIGQMRQVEQELKDETGKDTDDQMLADRLGVSMRRLGSLRKYQAAPIPESRFTTAAPGSDDSVSMPGVETENREEILLDYLYHSLGQIDRRVIDWKLGRNGQPQLPNVEIARRLRVSPAAVTQRAMRLATRLEELSTKVPM